MIKFRGLSAREKAMAEKIAARTGNVVNFSNPKDLTFVSYLRQGLDSSDQPQPLFTTCILLDANNVVLSAGVTKRCTYGGSKMNDEHNPQLAEDVAFQRAVRYMLGVDVT